MTSEQEIRQLMEQLDPEGKLTQDKIEDFIEAVKVMENNPPKDGEVRGELNFGVLEEELKQQMEDETDWRKKAALAAKIISLNLG
jgi:hypothetical protein